MMEKKRAAMIGFGKIGPIITSFLKDEFEVDVFDVLDRSKEIMQAGAHPVSLDQALSNDIVFYAVPISSFEKVFVSHLPIFKKSEGPKLIVDLLSVKKFPKEVFKKSLPKGYQAMLTHPMFGPNTLSNKRIVIDSSLMESKLYEEWEQRLTLQGLTVVNMDADEHDQLAARSQGLTHFISRVLDDFGLEKSPLDTLGTQKLIELRDRICSNDIELFKEMQNMNPYVNKMRDDLARSFKNVTEELKAWKI